jgi:hypothetical protein
MPELRQRVELIPPAATPLDFRELFIEHGF